MRSKFQKLSWALPVLAGFFVTIAPTTDARGITSVVVVGDTANILDRAWNTARSIAENAYNSAMEIAESQAQTVAIGQFLRMQTSQQSVYSRSQIQAQAQMMDTWDARETQRRITDWRMRAAVSSAAGASVCNVITGSVSARNAFAAVSKWREEITTQQLDYFTGSSPATAARRGAAAAIEQRNQIHCAVGASQYDVDIGLCSVTVDQTQTLDTGELLTPPVGRDLNANTLMNPAALTLSDKDRLAANAFLLHAFNGNVPAALPNGAATTADGRIRAAQNMTSAAQNSVAQAVVSSILADRDAMPGTRPVVSGTGGASGEAGSTTIAQWAEGTSRQTIGYDPEGNNFPNGVSRAAYMKLRAMAWFWNTNWASAVGSQSSDQTMKDLALIQAFSVYQNWESYQQLERINLTLATMLTIMEQQQRTAAR